jgi:hypothetical protein
LDGVDACAALGEFGAIGDDFGVGLGDFETRAALGELGAVGEGLRGRGGVVLAVVDDFEAFGAVDDVF